MTTQTLADLIRSALPPCDAEKCRSRHPRAAYALKLNGCGCLYLICAPCGLRSQWVLSIHGERFVRHRCTRCRHWTTGRYGEIATVVEL